MKYPALVCILILGGLAGADAEPEPAGSGRILTYFFAGAQVETKETCPVHFAVVLTARMPSPGWKLEVDDVAKPDAARRIRIKITGMAPKEPAAQVITPQALRVPLGTLAPGEYLLDLHYRTGAAPYRRAGAFVLEAY
ncbi:MAG: hypothetical protein ACYS6Z_17595 [Planctomycetota bacterium]|jgi:hypothetical protein